MAFVIQYIYNDNSRRAEKTSGITDAAHRQAKIAAVTEGKTLGVWIEEAILEKVEQEGSPR